MMEPMDRGRALAIVIDVASRWGENAEEAFARRPTAEDSDEAIENDVAPDPDYDETDREEAREIRDLCAVQLLGQELK